MAQAMLFAGILEAANRLTADEQEELISVLQRRRSERGHKQIPSDIQESRQQFAAGSCLSTTVDELMREIHVKPGNLVNKRRMLLALTVLYLITWIGGWTSHAYEIHMQSEQHYIRNMKENEAAMASGQWPEGLPIFMKLHESGPQTRVVWAVPLLPGVLLADYSQSNGPLKASGRIGIVIYYGIGSFVLCDQVTWLT